LINRDYILRLIERFSRALARIMFLREANQHQEALIFIDDLFRQTLGLSSSFLIAIPEEMLLGLVRRINELDTEKCLWIALLLKTEGDVYQDLQRYEESFPRYLRALFLFLEALLPEKDIRRSDFFAEVEELLTLLERYELPAPLMARMMLYYEKTGRYAQAEDVLFEALEASDASDEIFEQGQAFYARLRTKGSDELQAGNFSPPEIAEGLTALLRLRAARQASQEPS
jgi:tetratricopeptide (TPR) repeat protein